jgi:mono/diheme cytochrome c family protein
MANSSTWWGRMASCAAVGSRRCSVASDAPRPIANRPQITNLPHRLLLPLMIAATAFAAGDGRSTGRREKARALFLDACTACHTLERVRQQRLSKEEWRHLIAGMLSEGVPLTDDETSLLVDYLAENFGPENP